MITGDATGAYIIIKKHDTSTYICTIYIYYYQ